MMSFMNGTIRTQQVLIPFHGIFEKLKAGFLMVECTYADNDQLFSTISFHFKTYKTCCAGPFASKILSVPNKDIQQPILRPEHIPSTASLASEEINKQRKMARGQVSHGQLSKI